MSDSPSPPWWVEPTRDPALLGDKKLMSYDRALINAAVGDPALYAAVCREIIRALPALFTPYRVPHVDRGYVDHLEPGDPAAPFHLTRAIERLSSGFLSLRPVARLQDYIRQLILPQVPIGEDDPYFRTYQRILALLDMLLAMRGLDHLGDQNLQDPATGLLRRPGRSEDTAVAVALARAVFFDDDLVAARALADRLIEALPK